MALNNSINSSALGVGFVYSDGSGGLTASGTSLVTIFTSSGTWTKNAKTQSVTIMAWNSGNGGGSGRQGLTTAAGGGGGGAPGNSLITNAPAMLFNSSETVTISGTAAGGIAQASTSTNGIVGTSGGTTSLGNVYSVNSSTSIGAGGTTTTTAQPNAATAYILSGPVGGSNPVTQGLGSNTTGTAGGSSQSSATSNLNFQPSAGGGGGGADSGTIRAGGIGGNVNAPGTGVGIITAGGTAGIESGTINGGTGGNEISTTGGRYVPASGGGGGGGQSAGAAAGTGGTGGTPGAGGGGGGGSLNGTNSGAGGIGARGELWVIEFF